MASCGDTSVLARRAHPHFTPLRAKLSMRFGAIFGERRCSLSQGSGCTSAQSAAPSCSASGGGLDARSSRRQSGFMVRAQPKAGAWLGWASRVGCSGSIVTNLLNGIGFCRRNPYRWNAVFHADSEQLLRHDFLQAPWDLVYRVKLARTGLADPLDPDVAEGKSVAHHADMAQWQALQTWVCGHSPGGLKSPRRYGLQGRIA
jgi:hypothetical protein